MKRKLVATVLGMSLVFTMFNFQAGQAASAAAPKAKNVILMIPDGYSTDYATNYRLYAGKHSSMDPHLVGMVKTYAADSPLTDSAAAATAMATGFKTNNGMIGTTPDGKARKTILEAAREQGKATGLVATSTITDGTPAAFSSHILSRAQEIEIAPQQLERADVILGGGKSYFLPESLGGKQKTRNLIEEAKQSGFNIVDNRDQLMAAKGGKLLGLFANSEMASELDREVTNEPSLREMTGKAIEALQTDKDGFFLLVEGSQVDSAGHYNDAAWAMKDLQAFDEAVGLALEYAKQDGNTLVIVVSDHDTGGMSVGGYGQIGAKPEILQRVNASGGFMASKLNADRSNVKEVLRTYASIELTAAEEAKIKSAKEAMPAINAVISEHALVGWITYLHTGVDVPIYAFGPGSELFRGLHDNTDLPHLIAKTLHINFGGGAEK
ncbi:alkaline phosphatase [Paenibacillus sp. 481]|nr:alkaline phosphatase [Paenibacillus sp. 481]UHA75789.1 alkaline phosphatase [Paenibacillus sp. 481]